MALERAHNNVSGMKIMSLNGWGGKLHEDLVAYVKTACPDVLCLQEVTYSPTSTSEWLVYRDGDHILPQRANLFRDIADALPDHAAIFCPTAQGTLWDEQRPVPSQWGLATFVHRSLPIVSQAQGFVHKTFSPDAFGDHPRSRNAHVVRVYDFDRRRYLCVAHMHGLRDPEGKHDSLERRQQARRLTELVSRVVEPEDGLIVCGDFNVEPDSETFTILADLGLFELVTTRGFQSTRTSHYVKPGRFADYMLINKKLTVLDFSVVSDPEVSDHCPLVLTI